MAEMVKHIVKSIYTDGATYLQSNSSEPAKSPEAYQAFKMTDYYDKSDMEPLDRQGLSQCYNEADFYLNNSSLSDDGGTRSTLT